MNSLLFLIAVQLCWTPPTENVDGTPLTDLASYTIYWGETQRNYIGSHTINDPSATCYDFVESGNGTFYVAMTASNTDGDESTYSNEIRKVVDDAPDVTPPLPPVILASEETVYTVIKQPDRFVLLPIGTVPAGTECDLNNTVNGYGAVPNDEVQWSSATGPRPIVVVAQCNG